MTSTSATGFTRRRVAALGLAALFAPGLIAGGAHAQPAGGKPVSAADANADVKRGQTLLIDTREAYEKAAGSPEGVGAEIPYLMGGAQDARFVADVLRAVGGRRDASITLICQAGVRSAQAQSALERNGFTSARTVAEGFQGWSKANLPRTPAR